jgi:hypothetical protein
LTKALGATAVFFGLCGLVVILVSESSLIGSIMVIPSLGISLVLFFASIALGPEKAPEDPGEQH